MNKFENVWTEREDKALKPFIGTPVSIATADPAVRRIVNGRSRGAVSQRLYKLRNLENGNGKPHMPRKATRRKAKAPAPTPTTGTPLNYCPNCGCGLLAVRAALTL